MKQVLKLLFLVFRSLCYAALAVIVVAFAILIYLSVTDSCTSLGFDIINCEAPFDKNLAEYAISVVLLTVFTGLPGILAILGVIFATRSLYRKYGSTSPKHPAQTVDGDKQDGHDHAGWKLFGKIVALVLAVFFVAGIIAGILEHF